MGQRRQQPATRLRLRRLELGLSAQQLAAEASIGRGTLQRLEVGECGPRLDTARALAAALECDPLELFPAEGAPA